MIEQRSDEWFAARMGRVTASRIADVMARTKTGCSASRANYMAQLIAERLTGQRQESFTNAAMQWGTENEELACLAYAFAHDAHVEPEGFVLHPAIVGAGASPDGLVGDDGLVEIKCPSTSTHIDTLLSGKIADKYVKQMQFQMDCTGRAWCDFVSFDPRMPEDLRMFCQRVPRDDAMIEKIRAEVTGFLAEMAEKIAMLKGMIA